MWAAPIEMCFPMWISIPNGCSMGNIRHLCIPTPAAHAGQPSIGNCWLRAIRRWQPSSIRNCGINCRGSHPLNFRYGMAAVCAAAQASVPWAVIQVHKGFGVATAAHYAPNNYILA